jgi:hypothetical protein
LVSTTIIRRGGSCCKRFACNIGHFSSLGTVAVCDSWVVLGRGRTWNATVVALLVVLGACESGGDGPASGATATAVDSGADTEGADYCTEIGVLMSVLDDGGSVSDYDAALIRVGDAGPADHEAAWTLLLTLSQEPFDYENFNPAVDALDDISADLDATCPGVDRMIVDDDGRVRQFAPD